MLSTRIIFAVSMAAIAIIFARGAWSRMLSKYPFFYIQLGSRLSGAWPRWQSIRLTTGFILRGIGSANLQRWSSLAVISLKSCGMPLHTAGKRAGSP